jgi:hypothetical protein
MCGGAFRPLWIPPVLFDQLARFAHRKKLTEIEP